jgi:hypothetical protein
VIELKNPQAGRIKELEKELEEARAALKKSHTALRLLNSMILSGEQHSPQSVAAYKQAMRSGDERI